MGGNFAELPRGWTWATYEQIGKWSGGGTPSKRIGSYWSDGDIPWISPKDMKSQIIYDSEDKITEVAVENSPAKLIPSGSLLFVVRSGILRRTLPVALTRINSTINQDLKALKPYKYIFDEYLLYHALAFNEEIRHDCAKDGTTVESIEFSALKEYCVPIAPINEQHRIVAKIEELFSHLDAGVEGLHKVKAQLKRYRQAVLKAAVKGSLTEEWRKAHPEVEPADKLLRQAKHGRIELPDATNLFRLPDSWAWTSVDSLSEQDHGAICAGPFGTIFKAKDFRSTGTPIIFLRHISPGRYLTHKPTFMDESKWHELFKPYSVYGGELLVTKLGEPPGVCAIYPEV